MHLRVFDTLSDTTAVRVSSKIFQVSPPATTYHRVWILFSFGALTRKSHCLTFSHGLGATANATAQITFVCTFNLDSRLLGELELDPDGPSGNIGNLWGTLICLVARSESEVWQLVPAFVLSFSFGWTIVDWSWRLSRGKKQPSAEWWMRLMSCAWRRMTIEFTRVERQWITRNTANVNTSSATRFNLSFSWTLTAKPPIRRKTWFKQIKHLRLVRLQQSYFAKYLRWERSMHQMIPGFLIAARVKTNFLGESVFTFSVVPMRVN